MTTHQRLEATLTGVVGQPVEITVRGRRAFTFSTELVCPELGDRLQAYFGEHATISVEHDAECGSFAYATV